MLLNCFFKDAPPVEIKQISCDSRMPMEDCIFFCVRGIKDDGHSFIKEAINNGAKVIVYDKPCDTSLPCIYIKVNNVLDVLNQVAQKFYDYPGKNMENIVIAGSYGRNAVAFILRDIIKHYRRCAYIGSYGIEYGDVKLLSNEPTLTILENQRHLKVMHDQGVEACLFEADSYAMDLQKLDGVNPKALIYTNTSASDGDRQFIEDHVNSLARYIDHFQEDLDIIFNMDDPLYAQIANYHDYHIVTFAINNDNVDFYADDINITADGLSFYLHCFNSTYQVISNLLGLQNVYNLLAAIATLVERGYPIDEVIAACKNVASPEGVMEKIALGQKYNVVIDSCPTYESMINVLRYARKVVNVKHRIIVLFGLNSYSNHEKRERFGTILDEYADLVILTEDDPYEEAVMQIAHDIEKGIKNKPTVVIESREDAIAMAIELLNSGDMLLCLGKGQEKYMYRSLGREQYDGDSAIAKKYIKKRMEEENAII